MDEYTLNRTGAEIDSLGTRLESDARAMTTIAPETHTDLCSLTLTKGTWVLTGQMRLQGQANYQAMLGISTNSGAEQPVGGGFGQLSSTPYMTSLSINVARTIVISSSSQTVYLVGWHGYSAARSLDGLQTILSAVKVG